MDKIVVVFKLLPAIIAAIKAIEDALSGNSNGAEKLEAVRQLLIAVDDSVTNYWPTIQNVIGVMVGLFNKSGVFSKSA